MNQPERDRSWQGEAVAELRDQMLAILDRHEDECDEESCRNHINVIAYLAHCAGVRLDKHMPDFQQLLAEYESQCEGCSHMRN